MSVKGVGEGEDEGGMKGGDVGEDHLVGAAMEGVRAVGVPNGDLPEQEPNRLPSATPEPEP